MGGEASRQNGKKGGRPKGSKGKKTLEEDVEKEAFRQRVLENLQPLMNAQMSLAKGVSIMMKIEYTKKKIGRGKKAKYTTTKTKYIVRNPGEIMDALDKIESGKFEQGEYYYITTQKPDNKAIDSMLDRVFGKARQSLEVTGDPDNPLEVENTLSPKAIKKISDAVTKALLEDTKA